MVCYVTYKRISHRDRGQPELSLAMQDRSIRFFLDTCAEPGHSVIAEFADDQSSGTAPPARLREALSLCRARAATLLVARLDRLPLSESSAHPVLASPDIRLRVAVLPQASKAELAIHARLLAQQQAFCARQAAADMQRRARQGTYSRTQAAGSPSAPVACGTAAEDILAVVIPMRQGGATLRDIAAALNRDNVATARGTAWRPSHIARLLQLAGP